MASYFTFKNSNINIPKNIYHMYSKSYTQKMNKRHFPVLKSLLTINTADEIFPIRKNKSKTLKKKFN